MTEHPTEHQIKTQLIMAVTATADAEVIHADGTKAEDEEES